MTTVLTPGFQISMVQNQVYALPARRALFFHDSTQTFEMSTDVAFTAAKALTLTNGEAELAGGFLRTTTGTATVWLKLL